MNWKNRKSAILAAVALFEQGFTLESSVERVLGIDDIHYYNFFCTRVERISSAEYEKFEADVLAAIEERKGTIVYA